MCEPCNEFLQLLSCFAERTAYEPEPSLQKIEYSENVSEWISDKSDVLLKCELDGFNNYIISWFQRQCLCIFREITTHERLDGMVNNLMRLLFKLLIRYAKEGKRVRPEDAKIDDDNDKDVKEAKDVKDVKDDNDSNISKWVLCASEDDTEDSWTVPEFEKVLHLISKIFLVNFPLYAKHRLIKEDQKDIPSVSEFCDHLSETNEIPKALLIKVDIFCRSNGMDLIGNCFEVESIVPNVAHSLVTILCNVKMWLNIRSSLAIFFPLRSKILRLIRVMSDKQLRSQPIKVISDYLWNSIKEPPDVPMIFDKDGLDLALRYFTCTTLTMRLAGIGQINSQITLFNESCSSEHIINAESVAASLSSWIIDSDIISHIFGPNLHVELIKQSHVILNFMAMENRISDDHVNIIWQAAKLKHCSKQVFDVVIPLVKFLEPRQVVNFYKLLFELEPAEHTEQSLLLSSSITRFIWSSGCIFENGDAASAEAEMMATVKSNLNMRKINRRPMTSSESSSIDEADLSEPGSSAEESPCNNEGGFKRKRMRLTGPSSSIPRAHLSRGVCEQSNRTGTRKDVPGLYEINTHPVMKESIKNSESLKRLNNDSCENVGRIEKKRKSLNEDDKVDGIIITPSYPRMAAYPRMGKCRRIRTEEDDEDMEDELTESDEDLIPHGSIHSHHTIQADIQDLIRNSSCDQQVPIVLNRNAEDILSGEEGSLSSRMSTRSEKNMADFDGEEYICDDDLAHLATQQQQVAQITVRSHYGYRKKLVNAYDEYSKLVPELSLHNIYEPGSTLLWDLIQDDKIKFLAENVAFEAEKILTALLCYNTDRTVKMKFMYGCLDNVDKNESDVVALRILPKLCSSIQQIRSPNDNNQLTIWAFQRHTMIEKVFANLERYMEHRERTNKQPDPMTTHPVHIQVRLHYISHVFSPYGLPESISCITRLTIEEIDGLWRCLNVDTESLDELLSWYLRQLRAKEVNAFDDINLGHLYNNLIPSIVPEEMTMTGLTLIQHLSNLSRVGDMLMRRGDEARSIDHVWKVALKAKSTDVSMAAMQHINTYYMTRQLELEPEFVSRCMEQFTVPANIDDATSEPFLVSVQRTLLLLKTHLESFRRKYAYHLRRWALDGIGIPSHVTNCVAAIITVTVNPTGIGEKFQLEMSSLDYIADLRAEVTKWFEDEYVRQAIVDQSENKSGKSLPPFDGPLRLTTQGQELGTEFDEKTLAEIGFKDNQIVYLAVSASKSRRKSDHPEAPSLQPPPRRDCVPAMLLVKQEYFEKFFKLMDILSLVPGKPGQPLHTKAQVLSRRVWDILTVIPTDPVMLHGFQQLEELQLEKLFDSSSPHRLMYSMYIVEALSRPYASKNTLGKQGDFSVESTANNWINKFLERGGLKLLFNIFASGELQSGSEWQQDGLAHLLKLLCQLGVPLEDRHVLELIDSYGIAFVPPNCTKNKRRKHKQEKLVMPTLNPTMLKLMEDNAVLQRFTSILMEMSKPRELILYKTGFWGRAQVIHFAMALLLSWSNSCPHVSHDLMTSENSSLWVKKLVLEDPDPLVRREMSTSLVRLCSTNAVITFPLLSELMKFMDVAEAMKIQRVENSQHLQEEGKDPYGNNCRDYFWLICRVVDSLPDDTKGFPQLEESQLDELAEMADRIWSAVKKRDYLETRFSSLEDDGLYGMLNALYHILKHDKKFKFTITGLEAVEEVLNYLFAVPDPINRHLPKCKTQSSRTAAFDLLVELAKCCPRNYRVLHARILQQHTPGVNPIYPWDYWPHDEGRADCGYVGLTNLGATCYMASCMQHLFMMPEARNAILSAKYTDESKHIDTLQELQRMFAYLAESERKSYNPRSFCKVYTMDHRPINTAEQKDMAEFFIDLVSKFEEMNPELKTCMKNLFGGVITNNVVSLDCGHVSRTLEEFYTIRCQVADMRSLFESLNEVTVKDTLEGDNMYTCSQCCKKVRAEKRACFKKLPKVLCFNTMRYTFNMLTMTKEKVNTHFSFPMKLDMSGYVEKHLMPQQYQEEKERIEREREKGNVEEVQGIDEFGEQYEYELIGVTVHTGTADGGHYYCFIRDRSSLRRDRWYIFNDAEVKPFDPANIPQECFGGEMTSKTYDSVTDKYLDLSFEKTNSAYMLFYEWVDKSQTKEMEKEKDKVMNHKLDCGYKDYQMDVISEKTLALCNKLNPELREWIWKDNMQFLQDRNIFDHMYFQFVYQLCNYVPQSLENVQEMTELALQLGTTFFFETFIHSKEKPTLVTWVELLTKQFNMSPRACEWFLNHLAENHWWSIQILIRCPNQMIREMLKRICIHVIQRVRSNNLSIMAGETNCELLNDYEDISDDEIPVGIRPCVANFLRMLLQLLEHAMKSHWKYLHEYFLLLYEVSKMGEEEVNFLVSEHAIYAMVNFYLGHRPSDMDVMVEDEDDEEMIAMTQERFKTQSVEKMVAIVTYLLEKSRSAGNRLDIPSNDYHLLTGVKGFPFLIHQIRDNINLSHSRSLITSLCRNNEILTNDIITTIFSTLNKISNNLDMCQPFYRILTMLTETPAIHGQPSFTQQILCRAWEIANQTPYPVLDWLGLQVPRNKTIAGWVLQELETWLEKYILEHTTPRVRTAAAYLVINLVPCLQFRQSFRLPRVLIPPSKDYTMPSEARTTLHQIFNTLLKQLKPARLYVDSAGGPSNRLIPYLSVLNHCTLTKVEKAMVTPYIMDIWHLYHPKLSEPCLSANQNRQSLLIFWYHVLSESPEGVDVLLKSNQIQKQLPFTYILVDNDDQDVILYNRFTLPAYYGILRLMCEQSRQYTKYLASQQNILWAFKNIAIFPHHYATACEELFKLLSLIVKVYPDSTEKEKAEAISFRRQMIQMLLQTLDPRSCWATLIPTVKYLLVSEEDKIFFLYNSGLQMTFQAFQILHGMFHESTQPSLYNDMYEIMNIIYEFLKLTKNLRSKREPHSQSMILKDSAESVTKLAQLLNTFIPNEMRDLALEILKELGKLIPMVVITVILPLLATCHITFDDHHHQVPMGPYFPKKSHKLQPKVTVRPPKPMIQMSVSQTQLDAVKGVDLEYDRALMEFYAPYHLFVDFLCRIAVENGCFTDNMILLSTAVGLEGVPFHFVYFPAFWTEIYHVETNYREALNQRYLPHFLKSHYFHEYMEAILLEERGSLILEPIYAFVSCFLPKVAHTVLSDSNCKIIEASLSELDMKATEGPVPPHIAGTIKAISLVYANVMPPPELQKKVQEILSKVQMVSIPTVMKETRVFEALDIDDLSSDDASADEDDISEDGNGETVEDIDDDGEDDDLVDSNEDDSDSESEESIRRKIERKGNVKIIRVKTSSNLRDDTDKDK